MYKCYDIILNVEQIDKRSNIQKREKRTRKGAGRNSGFFLYSEPVY